MLYFFIRKLFKYLRYIFLPFVPVYLCVFYIIKKSAKPDKAGIPVICIGNITTGGTGKTPAVIRIAEILKQEGYKPGVISRGFSGTMSGRGGLISDGKQILLTHKEAGDEACLIATRLKNIPVAIAANRLKAVSILRNNADVDLILMDDGFQNNSIHKDISIISIDALKPFGNGLMLPAGDLRECKSSLIRSDMIFINKSDLADDEYLTHLMKRINRISGGKSVYKTVYSNEYITSAARPDERKNPDILKNKNILLVSGIGNPDAFCACVKKNNPAFIEQVKFGDHHKYKEIDIKRIIMKSENFDYILLTEKDYVKIKEYELNSKFYIFQNSVAIEREEIFSEELITLIKNTNN
jgi:tetraacyldisaccharide 4'-kinase